MQGSAGQQDAPVDAAWLSCALEHLGLNAAAAARLLDLEPDDIRLMLAGSDPVDRGLHEDVEAICRFTARVTDSIATQESVVVYRDDLSFMCALPHYADYCAAWHQLAAFRASIINPELKIIFDRASDSERLSA